MSAITDEAGAALLDEAAQQFLDESGGEAPSAGAGGGRVLRAEDFGAVSLQYESPQWQRPAGQGFPAGPWGRA